MIIKCIWDTTEYKVFDARMNSTKTGGRFTMTHKDSDCCLGWEVEVAMLDGSKKVKKTIMGFKQAKTWACDTLREFDNEIFLNINKQHNRVGKT